MEAASFLSGDQISSTVVTLHPQCLEAVLLFQSMNLPSVKEQPRLADLANWEGSSSVLWGGKGAGDEIQLKKKPPDQDIGKPEQKIIATTCTGHGNSPNNLAS